MKVYPEVRGLKFLPMILLLSVLFLSLLYSPPASGHDPNAVIYSVWATTPPTIDGTIDPAEWAPARPMHFTITTGGGTITGTIYVMNDGLNIYIAVEVSDTTDQSGDCLCIFFDNGDDGSLSVGEDGFGFYGTSTGGQFQDNYYQGVSYSIDYDPVTHQYFIDGGGARNSANPGQYEFWHPLSSGDTAHDFSLSPGDRVGFTVFCIDESLGPGGYWPASHSHPDRFGDIILAVPLAPAVGGVEVPIDASRVVLAGLSSSAGLMVAVVLLALGTWIHARKGSSP